MEPLSCSGHSLPYRRASLIEIKPDTERRYELQPVSSDKHPPRRLTPPEAFPDLDAALAARGIALKASAPCRRVDEPEEPLTDAAQQPADVNGRSSPHPVAFTGAVLGLALIGLLVFSVVRVSGDSIRPAVPILNMPATSTAAPTPVAAMPPPAEPAARPRRRLRWHRLSLRPLHRTCHRQHRRLRPCRPRY